MSDSEYSDSDSDNSIEEDFSVIENKFVKPFKIAKNITNEHDDSDVVENYVDFDYDVINQNGGEDDLDVNADIYNSDSDEDNNIDELNENKQKKIIELSNNNNYIEDDDEDYEDDDIEENYLQKFSSEITKNYINEYHPECLNHNYAEISIMTKVVRNSDNIIVDPFHKTIPYLTKFEKTKVLGQRAKQIENGAKPFVEVSKNIIEPYIIADLELSEKKIPFIIKRPMPNNGCEYWKLADLEILI
jgi:DNA-directed RNA polymerase I, II, and III subunit RPABC2